MGLHEEDCNNKRTAIQAKMGGQKIIYKISISDREIQDESFEIEQIKLLALKSQDFTISSVSSITAVVSNLRVTTPSPRGKNSFPTKLSRTLDLPELCPPTCKCAQDRG